MYVSSSLYSHFSFVMNISGIWKLTSTQGEWEAKGTESSTPFNGIDLSDEWYDYDEKAGDEVSVKEINWDIVKA